MSEKIVLTPEMIDKWLRELPEMEQQIWADHSLPQTFKLALTVVFSVCIAALEEVIELRKSQPTQRPPDAGDSVS